MTDSEYREEAAALRPTLVGVARQYVGDEAEDMVQDAMLRLWNMRGHLHSPMERMARVVVRNICIDWLRRRAGMQARRLMQLSARDATPAFADTAGQTAACERMDRMMDIIWQLPDAQQAVLRMRHIEGMEMADIAAHTGSSEAAVRKALSRARLAVRERYKEMKKGKNNEQER